MPRIDPERLLKTLAPLLESATGAIKSEKEVDKIYGLMSKFSKKLVSKCTYINILRASQPEVLDLFLQRGGWDMVLGWTQDAYSKKNFDLLSEIGNLLLHAPASVQRLKENELPKLIKSLSKDCENEEIREIAKKIVTKWIDIAKSEGLTNKSLVATESQTAIHGSSINNSVASTGSGKTETNSANENENPEFDITSFDLSQADINEMMDFNPEDFSNAVEQLGDLTTESATATEINQSSTNTNNVVSRNVPISSLSNRSIETLPRAPKLLIKTIGGQKAVVQNVGIPDSSKQDETPFCIVMKDGKPFLVRLKLASVTEVNQLALPAPNEEEKPLEVPSSPDKIRRPRKDPTITAGRSKLIPVPSPHEKYQPAILKTYSKKTPVEPVSNNPTAKPDSTTSSKDPQKDSKKEKKSSSSVKKPRSKESKSASAAAAAKKLEDEDKLREKIRQEKGTLKKRAKDAAKQKQQERDQETLKKLNLGGEPASNSAGNSIKIPKIPKKTSSFSDAIGIPGASDAVTEKVHKRSPRKLTGDSTDSIDLGVSPPKFYGKKEERKDAIPERRHRVKVYNSKKSRADDLLRDITENAKGNKSNKVEIPAKPIESQPSPLVDKLLSGNSLIMKPEKRPSTEGIEKPGDTKKQKLGDEKGDKKKESKDSNAVLKEKAKAAQAVIKESSLFMDALTATTEAQSKSTKRKRRLSSSNEKDVAAVGKFVRKNSKDKPASPTEDGPEESHKPVFNFYRDTLADNEKGEETTSKSDLDREVESRMELDSNLDARMSEENDEEDPFAASLDPGELKSVLVIHRSRTKPKKSVRWREEDELKEVHFFDLDETERVNVTKQKDFVSMKEHEKAEEKEFLSSKNIMRRILGNDDAEERMPWRKPCLLILPETDGPSLNSEEKAIQEERERINLGVFLPPGSVLPETPSEPDPISPDANDRTEFKIMPSEDVSGVTKVFDKRNDVWPQPDGAVIRPFASRTSNALPDSEGFGINRFGMGDSRQYKLSQPDFGTNPPNPNPTQTFDFNPWNAGLVTNAGLPNVRGIHGFAPMALDAAQLNMMANVPPPMAFPGPFNFNVPPPVANFSSIPNFNNMQHPLSMINNNSNAREPPRVNPQNSSHGRGNSSSIRDFGDRDHRRPYRDSRDAFDSRHDSRGRSRDYRSRDYDRDRRSPSPSRRRRDDRDRYGRDDKDHRDHDYRSRGRSGKKEVPCRYFKKGHCHNGSRCEFSHDSSTDPGSERSKIDGPRQRQTSPSILGSGPEDSQAVESSELQYERRASRDSTSNFTDAPSSPSDEIVEEPSLLLTVVSESAKIIPVE